MENGQFVALAVRLLRDHGEPLTQSSFPTDYDGYVQHAHEMNPSVDLSRVPIIGRIALHHLNLDHIEVRTTLSILNESAGVMPMQSTGRLLGSFDIVATEKASRWDLLWMRGDIHTSGQSVWTNTELDIDDVAGSESEQETLQLFLDFNRQLFNVNERVADRNDILTPEDLDAVSAHLNKTIGTMPLSNE